jgi:hypothetical protein
LNRIRNQVYVGVHMSATRHSTGTPLELEVRKRFGLLPNFVRPSPEVPENTANMWGLAQAACLDNPLPSLFKERLFVYLSRFRVVRYCIARHVGFLTGLGRPAGDSKVGAQTVGEIVRLLKRPLPRGERLKQFFVVAQNRAPLGELPDAAIRVEQVFDQIGKGFGLDTFCGYAMTSFQGDEGAQMFYRVCAEHSAVHS